MKIHITTLGCKVNQYETQAMETIFTEHGHTLCSEDEAADVCIINSCSVTAESDRKSRQAVRHARRLNPAAVIALCGCYSQTHPEEVEQLDVDIISGTGDRLGFIEAVERFYEDRRRAILTDNALRRRGFEQLPAGGMAGRTRAMLKVQDGCSNFCTYCIIPYSRGPVRSLPLNKAVEDAVRLYNEGYREIVVTGIEISSYGVEFLNGTNLTTLLEALCSAVPDMRIRLGSLEPRTITEDFCLRLKGFANLCPQFHLSLQSGCDATLARMHRRYTTAEYYECVRLINEHFANCAVTTDLITGFPGETEEEFAETLEFIERCRFSQMHIFPYSVRPGTPAAVMEGQVPKAVKAERAHRAGLIAARMQEEYLAACVGKTFTVLFEQADDGLYCGHAPNYTEVCVRADDLKGQLREVLITGVDGERLTGELI